MKANQTLFDININVLEGIRTIYEKEKPDLVLVHGDTSTTYASALAAYYMKIDVAHIEAGLRTYNIYSPFPEEFNRQAVGLISRFHFSPTKQAKDNLLKEGKKESSIFVTGNTVIDALQTTKDIIDGGEYDDWIGESKLILLTCHRRENLGQPMKNIFQAIKRIVENFKDIKIIYPIHKNPLIHELIDTYLIGHNRIKVVPPLDVLEFHHLLKKSYFVMTDSGGIQEEAPALGKPVLVLRDTTERPEGVEAGTLRLCGTNENAIYESAHMLLTNRIEYEKMSKANNPYGDGNACERIVDALINELF